MHRLSPSYPNTCVASICCHLAVFCDLLINLMVSRSPTLTSCMFHSCSSSTFRWYFPYTNGNLKLITVLPIAAIFKPVCLWSTNKIVKSVEPTPQFAALLAPPTTWRISGWGRKAALIADRRGKPVMASLRQEHRYGLYCGNNHRGGSGKRTLFHVKLTDTAIRALEAHQNLKVTFSSRVWVLSWQSCFETHFLFNCCFVCTFYKYCSSPVWNAK